MAVDSFSELLHKLKEVHEQEMDGWQEKVQELSSKKSCDTKRMEELFNRNQQLREQQRILTENIKQLENRLRAGLCDRCTVTQDVAKRRQQEYETSQMQSLQHISILATEINSLKRENGRLCVEVENLRGRLERQNGHSDEAVTPEVNQSPDPPPAAMVQQTLTLRSGAQPPGGATAAQASVKSEAEHSNACGAQEKLSENRKLRGWNGQQAFVSCKPHVSPISSGWRPEQSPVRATPPGERRATSVDSVELLSSPSMSSPLRLLKSTPFHPSSSSSSSSPAIADDKHSRRQVHAPVPFRPRPIKSANLSLPWPLPENSDWVTMATTIGGDVVIHHNPHREPNPALLRLPGLVPGRQGRGRGSERPWSERSPPPPAPRRGLSEPRPQAPAPPCWKPPAAQPERVFGENLRDPVEDAPLDLSDSGRSKSTSAPQDLTHGPSPQDGGVRERQLPGGRSQSHASPSSSSSSSPPAPPSSSSSRCSSSPASEQRGQSRLERRLSPLAQGQESQDKREEEAEEDENAEFSTNSEPKKVPVLTISLRPVVVLEALKSGLQLEDLSCTKKGEEEVEEEEESGQSSTRKRAGQDMEPEALHRRSLKEKRLRMNVAPQGKTHGDTEQG